MNFGIAKKQNSLDKFTKMETSKKMNGVKDVLMEYVVFLIKMTHYYRLGMKIISENNIEKFKKIKRKI